MKNIAIFASGTGSNARKIMEHFQEHPLARVRVLLSGKKDAPALDIARSFGADTLVLRKAEFVHSESLLDTLERYPIHFIVLAGFMWKIPSYLVCHYEGRMINIHPALLPKFGGKGMYGMHVHEAVIEAGETESGITIHWVNEHYDEGAIIAQERCVVLPADTSVDLAQRVQALEHTYYPRVIESLLGQIPE